MGEQVNAVDMQTEDHFKEKKNSSKSGWIFWGLAICLLLAWGCDFFDGVFWRVDAEINVVMFWVAAFLGLIWPAKSVREAWTNHKLCGLPLEVLLTVGSCLFVFGIIALSDLRYYIFNDILQENMMESWAVGPFGAEILCYCVSIAASAMVYFWGWYIGVCAAALFVLGLREYFKKKCLIVRFFLWVKRKITGAFQRLESFDLTSDANKTILKIVLVNAVILFVISSLWFGGFAVTLIYSVVLYLILRKYVSKIQKRYGILLNGINDIAEGNLNVTISEDLGIFEPFKPQVLRIQEGFKNAVENEVKSQRMKSELITNVSHDLKTPLTAIITYINLLKEKNITEEQREEYLDTLERKSLRLKVLIEDLFEVSKANSENATMNLMDVDILNLVKQVAFEMSDKLQESNLDVRMNLPEGKITLSLDSQKTYRVYENLFRNVAKYAMSGTRVYVSGALKEDCVEIVLRNIAAQEIMVDSTELTKRFVRNDASRNTEGSGLGLAIAKSFTELQGGTLLVEVDGDLFKVITRWPVKS